MSKSGEQKRRSRFCSLPPYTTNAAAVIPNVERNPFFIPDADEIIVILRCLNYLSGLIMTLFITCSFIVQYNDASLPFWLRLRSGCSQWVYAEVIACKPPTLLKTINADIKSALIYYLCTKNVPTLPFAKTFYL
jgi:hypothetical protein